MPVQFLQLFRRLGQAVRLFRLADRGPEDAARDAGAEVQFQLLDEAALFPAPEPFRARIQQQPNVAGPPDHPVEVVRPDGVLILVGGQVEAAAQFRRHEGRCHAAAREDALVAAQHDEVLEIQGARLQRAHHLQALQRLAAERHRRGGHQLLQQAEIRSRSDGKFAVGQAPHGEVVIPDEIQLQRHPGHFPQPGAQVGEQLALVTFQCADRLRVASRGRRRHRPEDAVEHRQAGQFGHGDVVARLGADFGRAPAPFFPGQGLENAVGEDGPHGTVVEVPRPVLLAQVQLQGGHVRHQGAQRTSAHRVAHRHVDLGDPLRQGVQHRQEQPLVGQHDGRLDADGAQPVQDGRNLLGLADARGHAQHADFGHPEALRIGFEGLGELQDVLRQEQGRLVRRIADPARTVIPAELR